MQHQDACPILCLHMLIQYVRETLHLFTGYYTVEYAQLMHAYLFKFLRYIFDWLRKHQIMLFIYNLFTFHLSLFMHNYIFINLNMHFPRSTGNSRVDLISQHVHFETNKKIKTQLQNDTCLLKRNRDQGSVESGAW